MTDERRVFERRTDCGPGAPTCDDHIHRIVQDRLDVCKTDIGADIHQIRETISKVESKQDTLTADVHKLGIAVTDIAINSKSIAKSLEGMGGMIEAYNTVSGFTRGMRFIKDHLVFVFIVVVVLLYAAGKIDLPSMLGYIL